MIPAGMSTQARRRSGDAAQPALTVPAPPNDPAADDDASFGPPTRRVGLVASTDDDDGDEADARPTTVPTYDVEALAAASSLETQLPRQAGPLVALDLAVPIRRRASLDGVPLRAAFLLLHVDDRMSVAEIALTAQIPVAEAIESFVLLADLGVVELRGAADRQLAIAAEPVELGRPRSKSGLRPKT